MSWAFTPGLILWTARPDWVWRIDFGGIKETWQSDSESAVVSQECCFMMTQMHHLLVPLHREISLPYVVGEVKVSVSHSVMSDYLWPPWTVARQVPLSMGFSRQEYWSGLPFSSSGDLPEPGTEPASLGFPALQADSLLSEPPVGEEMNVKGIRCSVSSCFLPTLVILKLIS